MLKFLQIVKDLFNAKSSRSEGRNGERLKYAQPFLCLLLSIGFMFMFKHCYISQGIINSVSIPLIKNKCGDQTGKKNYRTIALSSIIFKVFEHVIEKRIEVCPWTNYNQFGFRLGHSIDLGINALPEFIESFKVVPPLYT